MTGDRLRGALSAMTTTLFGGSKTVEKDLDLVILTSDTLFQHVKTSLDLFCLLTLQLNDGPAVEADPLVHVVDHALLFVDGSTDIVLHVADDSKPILQTI